MGNLLAENVDTDVNMYASLHDSTKMGLHTLASSPLVIRR